MAHTGHLELIERELRALLNEGKTEDIVTWVKERVLESYRNGKAAAAPAKDKDTTRAPKPRTSHYQP
jgi:hypothetical protein